VENGFLFSGQGTSLQIYSQAAHKLLASSKIFKSQIIHGVATQNLTTPSTFLVWGGRYLAAVCLTRGASRINTFSESVSICRADTIKLPDWIFEVSFKPDDRSPSVDQSIAQPECAVLVTAHNVLFKVHIPAAASFESAGGSSRLKIELLHVGPRCILYSAHLNWSSPTEILVASGTAFGEIVAWSYITGDQNVPGVRPHITLTGHEGSIFGVRISEIVTIGPEAGRRFLTSCSDDRTIRVWDISNLLSLSVSSTSRNKQQDTYTTGFLSHLTEDTLDAVDDRCVTVAMGHLSRIWGIRYSYSHSSEDLSVNASPFAIVSIGEDASCQIWNFHYTLTDLKINFSLTHVQTREYHSGKNIWSVALLESSDNTRSFSVFTGGADSRTVSASFGKGDSSNYLEQWDIGDLSKEITQITSLSVPESGHSDRRSSRIRNNPLLDCFRSYTFVRDDTLLVTTNNGLVLTATFDTSSSKKKSFWRWDYIDTLDELKGFSVATSLDDWGYAFLAGAKGAVYVFNSVERQLSLLVQVHGKVSGLFVQKSSAKSSTIASLLVARMGDQAPRHIHLQRSHAGKLSIRDSGSVTMEGLTLSKFTVTSYAYVTTNREGGIVFLGCREGTILSYCSISRSRDIVISRAHGQDAVTGLRWVAAPLISDIEGWLLSVGRDGACCVHQFSRDGQSPLLVHKLTLPFGPNIEGIYVTQSTNDICIYGFHGKSFVVHNLATSCDIMTAECGGAHRVWTYKPSLDSTQRISGGTFAWTKASKLNACSVSRPNHTVIESGGHGREIRVCAVAPRSLQDTTFGPLVATGAEDTDIRMFSYSRDSKPESSLTGSLQCMAILRRHVTGVQSIEWSSDGQYLFSCGGYEEFFVWKLQAAPCVLVGVVCESSCPIQVVKSDLRITDFAVRNDTREGVDSDEESGVSFLIAMAYSNSAVKVFSRSFLDLSVGLEH
jgi:WD40 repeat protein